MQVEYKILFIFTAFIYQLILIAHFTLRKRHLSSAIYYGPIVYALSIPAAIVSIVLMVNHQPWFFWISGLLYLLWAVFGYWTEYIKGRTTWRSPVRWSIFVPYISLYLATVMFYWWPLARINKPLWVIYALLYLISTYQNITSHKRAVTLIGKPEPIINFQGRTSIGGLK